MIKKEILSRLTEIEKSLLIITKEIAAKNKIILIQEEIVNDLRAHLNKTMDRLMSRNFQELATYTSPVSPFDSYQNTIVEDDLVGAISPSSIKPLMEEN